MMQPANLFQLGNTPIIVNVDNYFLKTNVLV